MRFCACASSATSALSAAPHPRSSSTPAFATMKTPWLAPPHEPPQLLETPRLRLRPLRLTDAVRDYDAVMTSREQLWDIFGPGSDWPLPDLTLEQDMIDLGWHQKEHQMRLSFAFTVESLDRERILGCVYFFPAQRAGFDAQCFYWARSSELASGLEAHLGDAVRGWLSAEWPWWRRVAFPGRDIGWDAWEALPPA